MDERSCIIKLGIAIDYRITNRLIASNSNRLNRLFVPKYTYLHIVHVFYLIYCHNAKKRMSYEKLSIIWNKTSKRASKQYPNNSLLEFPLSRIYLKLSYQLKVSLETEHKYLLTQILSYVHLPISMILNISYFKNILLQKINKEIRAFFSVAHIYQIKILILCSII